MRIRRDGAGDDRRTTVCLVMIVRNEAHIISETLDTLTPHIDTWSIVDTGSTDGTQDVVRNHFARVGIEGTLHERSWVGFAHNRTEALELARGTADYSFMMDADDLLIGVPDLGHLDDDGYLLRLRGSGTEYWRPQIFSQSKQWEYRGAVHEYAVCLDGSGRPSRLEGDYHIEVRHLGDRNVRGDKYERDTELLRAALEADPNDSRSVFYLAQTQLHAGNPAEAYELYTRRAEMGGWNEEVFYSHLQRAAALRSLDEPWERELAVLLEAWNTRPTRNEPLVEIARHYRSVDDWPLAHFFAQQADGIPFPHEDVLFVSSDSHLWQAKDERAISAFYVGLHRESFDICNELLGGHHLPAHERDRVLFNREHGAKVLLQQAVTTPWVVIQRLAARAPRPADEHTVTLTITTCKRRELFEQTIDSFLSNCVDVDRIDRWICIDDGSSPDDLAAMRDRYPFFEFIEKVPSERGHAMSMRRLHGEVRTKYWLHLEDDWRFFVRDSYVSRAIDILEDDELLGQVLFNRNYAETLEDRNTVGGEVRYTRATTSPYRLHTHFDPNSSEYHAYFSQFEPGSQGCVWWPNFSLRPSMMRTSAITATGEFDSGSDNFELEFAHRYTDAGHRSAFFDTITCVHLGPLTSDRGVERRSNAYDLNRQPQFAARTAARVRLVSNWAPTDELHRHFERQAMGDRRWNAIELVDDPDLSDHTVVLNRPVEGSVERASAIVLHMEPESASSTWGEWSSPDPREVLQSRTLRNQPNVAEWHLGATWSELGGGGSRGIEIVKTRDLSTVTSNKESDVGQRLRLGLIRHLVANGVEIDVFGAGAIDGVPNHKGLLPAYDKRDGLFPYRYTFAAENNAQHNYVTEKLYDAILSECLCFYWGCPNVDELIDPASFVSLPLDDLEESQRIIERAIADDLWSQRLPAIRAEKQRILDEYQLFPTIERTIRGARMLERLPIKVVNLDRRPDRWEATTAALAEALDEQTLARVERVRAVDGMELAMTTDLEHLFRNNDFHFRRGMIGCALTHLEIWREVARSNELTLVLEDDVTFIDDFRGQLIEALGQLPDQRLFDLAYLGAFRVVTDHDRQLRHPRDRWSSLSWQSYGGGTFGYLVTPHGARRLLAVVERDGIQNGIDWLPKVHPTEFHALECTPDLVLSEPSFPGISGDSDIQHDWVSVADPRRTPPDHLH